MLEILGNRKNQERPEEKMFIMSKRKTSVLDTSLERDREEQGKKGGMSRRKNVRISCAVTEVESRYSRWTLCVGYKDCSEAKAEGLVHVQCIL